jgi:hypothetical protein
MGAAVRFWKGVRYGILLGLAGWATIVAIIAAIIVWFMK